MTNVTLDSLLASLEENGLAKQAAEAPEAKTATTSVGKELENILSKQANEVNLVNAQQKGQAIADSVVALLKQASEGGNRVITETAAHVASSSAGIAETPREGNSITNTLQGLVANGIANGAVRPDALDEHLDQGGDEGNGQQGLHASDEHNINATHEGSEMDDEVEKTAALIDLVDRGYDFNTAVDMIKQAEYELLDEEYEQVKQAAVVGLLNEGMDIESAVQLVKVAMEVDPGFVKEASKKNVIEDASWLARKAQGIHNTIAPSARKSIFGMKNEISDLQEEHVAPLIAKKQGKIDADYIKNQRRKKPKEGFMYETGQKIRQGALNAEEAARNAYVAGKEYARVYGPAAAVGTAAVGIPAAGVYAYNHREKRAAAVSYLLSQGYDVQTALDMIDGE